MGDEGPEPVNLKVNLHFKDAFVLHPSSYVGEKYLVTDMDFSVYMEFVERFVGESCEKVFYSQNNRPLETELEVEQEPNVQINKKIGDDFLRKLCVLSGSNEMDKSEDNEDEACVEPTLIFNLNIGWKLQELMDMRLWATWMSTEHYFHIKSLKPNHQCARNFKFGSGMTYQWIGGHYTKEILHRQKLTIRQIRLEVIKKFGIAEGGFHSMEGDPADPLSAESMDKFENINFSGYLDETTYRFNLLILRPILAVSFVLTLLVFGWFLAWKLLLVHVPLVQEIFGLKKKPCVPKPLTRHRFSRFYNTLTLNHNDNSNISG
ncbi:hypothetical protein LXL04_038973 [Taraxacum kok-saghyz]